MLNAEGLVGRRYCSTVVVREFKDEEYLARVSSEQGAGLVRRDN
jgi:hypothetical protein